jgi:RNA polymerase sigma factor (TIGR02999 family)
MSDGPGRITAILQAGKAGNELTLAELFDLVYPELRRRAQAAMRGERSGHTLQPTALVHEAFLRMFDGQPVEWNDSQHFYATAAREMRRILTDHARRALAQKRQRPPGEANPVADFPGPLRPEELIDLDRGVEQLRTIDPLAASVLELKYIAGFNDEETAAALGISVWMVPRHWQWARAVMKQHLGRGKSRRFALMKGKDALGTDRKDEAGL